MEVDKRASRRTVKIDSDVNLDRDSESVDFLKKGRKEASGSSAASVAADRGSDVNDSVLAATNSVMPLERSMTLLFWAAFLDSLAVACKFPTCFVSRVATTTPLEATIMGLRTPAHESTSVMESVTFVTASPFGAAHSMF